MRRPARARRLVRGAAAAAGIALVLVACGPSGTSQKTIAEVGEWKLTPATLESEFDRIHGEGAYEKASLDRRKEFAETLFKNQLLVRVAAEACPEPDRIRQHQIAIELDDALHRDFGRYRREHFPIPPEERADVRRRYMREADLLQVQIKPTDAQAIRDRIAQGAGFDSLAAQYAIGDTPEARQPRPITLEVHRTIPVMMGLVFDKDVPPGGIVGPVGFMGRGYLFKLVEYRPIDVKTDTLAASRGEQLIDQALYQKRDLHYVDSLKTAVGLTYHSENFGRVHEIMKAYWDSLRTVGIKMDPAKQWPPVWRLTEKDRTLPLAEFSGKTLTVADFIQSLDTVGPGHWPTGLNQEKTGAQIESRVTLMILQNQARAVGYADSDEFAAARKRIEEGALLDQFHDRYLLPTLDASPEEVRAEYDANPDRYRGPDDISLALIVFGKDHKDKADQFLEKIQKAGVDHWDEMAPEEAKVDEDARYLPDSGAITLDPPTYTNFQDFLTPETEALDAGQISGVMNSTAGWGIIRVNQRHRKEVRPFDDVSALAKSNVIALKADAVIEKRIEAERQKLGGSFHPEWIPAPETEGESASS